MILKEAFEQFTVYKCDVASSFLYAHFDNPALFMDGLSEYLLSESNLLNYANTLTPIEFTPTPAIYKKLYNTLGSFLNSELELLAFDDVSDEVRTTLGKEYRFININGKTLIQKDKIGKIGEYALHLLLTSYYKVHCIIPKFRCTTDRNMSVFGIDALFFNPEQRTIYFGESKVCNSIESAITLVNRSFDDYEEQIAEEYKLVLSNDEVFNLSQEFIDPEKQYDFSQRNIFIVTHDRVIDENTVAIFGSIDFLVIDEVYKLQKDSTNERVLILNIAYYNMVRLSKICVAGSVYKWRRTS